MEKMIFEKLNEISKILIVAHQKVEYLQKILFIKLKKSGKLQDFKNYGNFENTSDKE